MVCYQRRWWHPTPVLLPGKSHGWRDLLSCSPWGLEELDATEWLHFHFSLSCIGEGNGNPLQCSCLENPRNREAWWAAVYGVIQSRTWLKWLSSSSSHPYGRKRRTKRASWWKWKRKVKKLASNSAFRKLRSWQLIWSLHGKRWGNSGNSEKLFLGSPKLLQMVTAAMKLKDTYSLEGKLWPT